MKQIVTTKTIGMVKPSAYLWSFLLLFLSTLTFAGSLNNPRSKFATIPTNLAKKNAIIIKGTVTDQSNGQTLPGVSIKVKGSTIGTVTDTNGSFSLEADENSTLVFSYLGYQSTEVPVNSQKVVNVILKPSSKDLDEVIVVGYGSQKKTSTTVAASTVNTKDIAQKPVVNLTNSLVGRASGLIATQGGGEPGFDGSDIQIRGLSSIGRTAPLYIVDGVPRDFSRLDPNTIATVTVLKDAAAVAPYGVAGANGVILITTKAGTAGKATLTYNGYAGIQNPTKVPTFVNSHQYALLRNEAATNDGQALPYTETDIQKFLDHSDPDGHADGQPLKDIIMPDRLITNHNVSLTGGNDDFKYFASVGYTHQDGMWSTTFLDKYNGSLNLTANATKTTTVNFSVNSYLEDQNFPSVGAGSIINQAQRQNPTVPIYYSNGLWSGYIGQSLIGEIYHSGYAHNQNTALLSQLSIDQKLPLKGLSLKGIISYDSGPDPLFGNQTSVQRIYTTPIPFYTVNTNTNPYSYPESIQGNSKPTFEEKYFQNRSLTYQGLLNYAGTFGKSSITGLFGVEYRTVKYQNFSARKINYNLDIDELDFGGPLPTDATVSGGSGGQEQLGYIYRLGYAYDNKYLFEATGRYDGSYLFAPGNRFGFFPAFSVGWRLSEEGFIKNNFDWINNLKIRGSWGQSGAYPSVGGGIQTYQYLSPYNVYANSAVIGGSATQGISEALQGNPDITWEKANKTDIGLEATLWNGLLGLEADYFYEKRSNMLISIGAALPGEYGIGTGPVNAGVMENRGFDLTLSTSKAFSNGLRLDVKGTFTYAKNKLLSYAENTATFNNPNRRLTGRSWNQQFGLDALGYFSSDDFVDPNNQNPVLKPGIPVPSYGPVRPGDIRYSDLSGPNGTADGRIDDNDITDIGRPNTPQIVYGLAPHLSFKNFDLDLLFQGTASSSIYLNNYFVYPFLGSGSATELVYKDHWSPNNPDALYPRISGTPSNNNTQKSSWWMRNDAYIRLKSAEVGYTFSNKLLGNTIRSLRLYVAGQNIFTWMPSVKETFDPENSGSNQNYYQQRVFSIGLNATF